MLAFKLLSVSLLALIGSTAPALGIHVPSERAVSGSDLDTSVRAYVDALEVDLFTLAKRDLYPACCGRLGKPACLPIESDQSGHVGEYCRHNPCSATKGAPAPNEVC